MLSYRHSFHAGNFADVLKHIVLIEILQYLCKKPTPFAYIDTHAGAGLYDLQSGHAAKLNEAKAGFEKLRKDDWPELAPYFQVVEHHRASRTDSLYPGSPMIAHHFLRLRTELFSTNYTRGTLASSMNSPVMIPVSRHARQTDSRG